MLTESFHVAVPTAFYEDESLNVQGTISHIKHIYQQGVKSILVSGTTGEQHSMTLQEKLEIIDALESEEELISNMEIIFGAASIRLKEAELLAEKIGSTRLAGIMIGYPPYVVPSQQEAVLYTERIVAAGKKPAILYNNPNRTGFDLTEESIIQLSRLNRVVGIKEAGDKVKVKRLRSVIQREDFYFYAGGEVDLVEKVGCGYNRLSSMAGNVNPEEINQWFNKMLTNQTMSTQESEAVQVLMEQVYDGNPVVNIKAMLNDRGIPMGVCRSPIGMVYNNSM
ncbi:4-hydroxy-tetrahydrodipicolinate synthase [Sinobaca qinghaiensis]|uniref:4-hydroxy-tetrahydrodipicolinate synthase n=1 Tax=Sinobaca qinghaiensis TaxID=342944 RepID=A0A419UWZ9_9BACL|nr:dihydrodipicolinate synthase family protein [Sinobaca qinghaiensis]RKD69668.1 4-hydroxy-tetrahydrodipicolinate synthase [Sinobaca qinghaiensis]